MIIAVIVVLLIAYLLGAIPFGLILANLKGVDLRHQGSGNIGATNVFRCVSKGCGILTFVLDMVKGALATFIPLIYIACIGDAFGDHVMLWRVLCGVVAILGHLFPVYIGFKGGKGVSTSLGLLIGVAPICAAIGLFVWIICFVLSRYVSLASCMAAVAVGVGTWVINVNDPVWFRIMLSALALLAILKHSKNIVRLVRGTENRFAFTQKQRDAIAAKKAGQNV